jgi:hypothetical protein
LAVTYKDITFTSLLTLTQIIMGYTHYWDLKNPTKKNSQQFIDVMLDVEVIMSNLPKFSTSAGGHYKQYPIVVKNGLGEGLPIITRKEILINGDASENLDHETFYFNFVNHEEQSGFCKTARKPYDFVVCCILISLANRVEGFEVSSDGDWEDWKDCYRFYEECVSKNISDNVRKCLGYYEQEQGIRMD